MLTDKPRFPVKEILLYGLLPSWAKKLVYRWQGYRIGKGVTLGLGSVICARDVEIGDHTRLGFLAVVRGDSVRIGRHVQIGSVTILDTPNIEIGDGTKINEQVFVGGLQFPDSRFVVGRNCQIMQMTCINPARSITIGDDTGIGGHCLIFGHTSWLSKFEGYPVDFQPVEIGRSVSLAWRVFVMPGVTIGDGAVVGANSLVNRPVPPRCLAVGFPARVVGQAPYFPRQVGAEEKAVFFKDILAEMIVFFGASGLRCHGGGGNHEISEIRRRWFWKRERSWRLAVESGIVAPDAPMKIPANTDVLLSLQTIPDEVRGQLAGRGVLWIDIERKERADLSNDLGEEVVQFLRRYGVRFFRVGKQSEGFGVGQSAADAGTRKVSPASEAATFPAAQAPGADL